MLETIEAGQPAWNEPQHRSPGAAVNFSKFFDRLYYKEEGESCLGKTIRSVQWSSSAFQLNLDNE